MNATNYEYFEMITCSSDSTWEPLDNLDCPDLIEAFHQERESAVEKRNTRSRAMTGGQKEIQKSSAPESVQTPTSSPLQQISSDKTSKSTSKKSKITVATTKVMLTPREQFIGKLRENNSPGSCGEIECLSSNETIPSRTKSRTQSPSSTKLANNSNQPRSNFNAPFLDQTRWLRIVMKLVLLYSVVYYCKYYE